LISYSTNWMGPIDMGWYERNGVDYEKTRYSGGRIDIRDDSKYGYDGWYEYSLPLMRTEDWNDFSDWLDDLETEELLSFEGIIKKYFVDTGRIIRWWKEDAT
jgi:hypothetical protein